MALFAKSRIDALNLVEAPGGFRDSHSICGIVELWRQRCRAERLPARHDLPMAALRPWIGNVSLVDVRQDPPGFRWRLVGTHVALQMGRDVTGRDFADLYRGRILADYLRLFTASADRRRPVYYRGDLEFLGREFVKFRTVHLPLADDGRTVNMLLVHHDFV